MTFIRDLLRQVALRLAGTETPDGHGAKSRHDVLLAQGLDPREIPFLTRHPDSIDVSELHLVQGDAAVIAKLELGASAWNAWRNGCWATEPRAKWPNLYRGGFGGLDLAGALLWGANLEEANLTSANLRGATLKGACLKRATLVNANLEGADLQGADLTFADLRGANLRQCVLGFANICCANLESADLSGSLIYGISAWDVQTKGSIQHDLVVTRIGDPIVTTDHIGVGQLMYTLIENQNLRGILDTITSKTVLILGRFTNERKVILDALRDSLRRRDCVPILFDFEGPASRDITETVSTLAHLARFVVADITDARSIPQELTRIVPYLPSVPVQPLLLRSQSAYAMSEHFKHFPWYLKTHYYDDLEQLERDLDAHVIRPAEEFLATARNR